MVVSGTPIKNLSHSTRAINSTNHCDIEKPGREVLVLGVESRAEQAQMTNDKPKSLSYSY